MFDPAARRVPDSDPQSEWARTDAYWAWLDAMTPETSSAAHVMSVMTRGPGASWVRLGSRDDADYEARFMRHSIGYCWDQYSALGDLFSLRDGDNRPLVTVLVKDGAIVHAREAANARLSQQNDQALREFAETFGYDIVPDELPFDLLPDDGSPNTRFRYLLRDANNNKASEELIFPGRLGTDGARDLVNGLRDGRFFDPRALGLPDATELLEGGADPARHEILSIRFVADLPTSDIDADSFKAAWDNAASNNWQLPKLRL